MAEIEMARTNCSGAFLLVEGSSDECFFRARVVDSTYIIDSSGRRNVEDALSLLDSDSAHSTTKVLGVIDEDYDWFIGYDVESQNIVKFDPRDLEGLLLRSSALGSVLAEFGNVSQIRVFEAREGRSVRDALVGRADVFGRIRMVNASGAGVCLKSFKPQRFCNVATWSYDLSAAKDEAVRLGVAADRSALEAAIASTWEPDLWHVVRGHDLVDILVGGLKQVLGSNGSLGSKEVDRILRQSLQMHELHASDFFRRLSAWQIARGCEIL